VIVGVIVGDGVGDPVTDGVGVKDGDISGVTEGVTEGVTVGVRATSSKHPPPPCKFKSTGLTGTGFITFCVICKATQDVLKNSSNSFLSTNASFKIWK
jgi:hypothetical protein